MKWDEMTNSAIIAEIGNALRQRRISLKLNRKELSEKTGIAMGTLNRIENGIGAASIENLILIMKELGLIEALEELFTKSNLLVNFQNMTSDRNKISNQFDSRRFRKKKSEDAMSDKKEKIDSETNDQEDEWTWGED